MAVAHNAPAGRYTAEPWKVFRACNDRLDTRAIMLNQGLYDGFSSAGGVISAGLCMWSVQIFPVLWIIPFDGVTDASNPCDCPLGYLP